MLSKERLQRQTAKPIEVSSADIPYPGLTALHLLPEHRQVTLVHEKNGIKVDVENKDGYSVSARLRNPDTTDFQGHALKQAQSKGQLIVDGDIFIQITGRKIMLLEAFRTAYPNYIPSTIAVEASSSHLQHFPMTNDVFARSLFYGSRAEFNPRGNTANHQESNSVRLDIFPSSDLTIFFLIHELVELCQLSKSHSEQITTAKLLSNHAYQATHELLVANKMIDPAEKGMELMKKILEMAAKRSGTDSLGQTIIDCAVKYHWYMATKKMALADKEKETNETALAFLIDAIPGLQQDGSRIRRLKIFMSVLNRWHDRQVGVLQLKIEELTGRLDVYNFEAFLSARKYDAPVQALDATLRTWIKAAHTSVA